jgi:GGDEF domain-containing protein
MQLGSLELQIFVALILVLGSAFVALICDFLKGNNEQLRERNIELRVRQDERERMGLFQPLAHPITWLQGLTALARNPGLAEAMAGSSVAAEPPQQAPPAAEELLPEMQADLENLTGGAAAPAGDSADDRNPLRRHRYDEFKASEKQQTWATKEELEQLAGRAARIRARHEASHRKPEEQPLPAPLSEVREAPRRPKVAELPKLEQLVTPSKPVEAEPVVVEEAAVAAQAPVETAAVNPVAVPEPAPPPMVETPAASEWVFRVASEGPKGAQTAPELPEALTAVVKPEAPALVSELPSPEPAAPGVAPAEAATDPVINIWRQPVQTSPAVQPEPIRTRIQAVEVVPRDEAITEQFAPPAEVVAKPAEAAPPALDVAALQKATGESRPAVRPLPMEPSPEVKLEIPAGLHEAAVLSQLIENQTPYSGVVVAIGINDYDALREKLSSGADSVAALNKMVLSMLRPQDFACRFQDDEYILIYPGERGSSAQRRLFQVSEKLWDFQLRSLGNLSVMFSWGGLEVTNETLAEAVASARERMYQTKRNRKPSGLEFAVGRKKVVNG